MRDVLPELMKWWEGGETIGVGTVVTTFRSAPRPPGASMLVCPDDSAVGSVSGGCVEGAVYDLAQAVVESGEPVLQRYGVSDDVVVDWPHRCLTSEKEAGRIDPRTIVTVLTHDPKFDVPLLEVALRMPEIAYVGAMGSRRTHQIRMERLREMGLTKDELGRLDGPIGLDLGARTPEETAISIVAEIIAGRWGGTGSHLRDTLGQIHESADRSLAAL